MYDIVFASKHDKNVVAFNRFKIRYPNAKWLTNVKTLSQAVSASVKMCMTSMHWLITDDVLLHPDLDLTWKTDTWDRPYPHIWITVDSLGNPVNEYAGVYLIPNRYKVSSDELETGILSQFKVMPDHQQVLIPYDMVKASYDDFSNVAHACEKVSDLCHTEMHWVIMDDVVLNNDFDLNWRPPVWDRQYVHVWKTADNNGNELDNNTGVYLVPCNYQPTNIELEQGSLSSIKFVDPIASTVVPYDIFFISYNEQNAESNFRALQTRFPAAQHVSGIKGINNAHMRCAELSKTSMFWTVDADTIADDSFTFSYRPPDHDRQYLHLWHSRNPVNGLNYGWGAIKLWPTRLVREFKSNWLDFTTTVGNIKIIPDIIATTNYNCDEMSTWRSGFREAVKLCVNVNKGDFQESMERLMVWLTAKSSADWSEASKQGAMAGTDFYLECKRSNDTAGLKQINDFEWLEIRFNNRTEKCLEMSRSDLLSVLRE